MSNHIHDLPFVNESEFGSGGGRSAKPRTDDPAPNSAKKRVRVTIFAIDGHGLPSEQRRTVIWAGDIDPSDKTFNRLSILDRETELSERFDEPAYLCTYSIVDEISDRLSRKKLEDIEIYVEQSVVNSVYSCLLFVLGEGDTDATPPSVLSDENRNLAASLLSALNLPPERAEDAISVLKATFGEASKQPASAALPDAAPAYWRDRPKGEKIEDFLRRVWKPWIDAGVLTRPDLYRLDPPAYRALGNRPLPDDIQVPTKSEIVAARAAAARSDPEKQKQLREARRLVSALQRELSIK